MLRSLVVLVALTAVAHADATPATTRDAETQRDQRDLDAGIQPGGLGQYAITRAFTTKLLADPMRFLRQSARVVPAVKDGKVLGLKLYAIKAGSLLERLGLRNGDTITAIDGITTDSLDRALEIYTRLSKDPKLRSVVVELTRRGVPMKLTYAIK